MEERNKEIVKLRLKGWGYQRLASKYNISRQRIHQIVTNYDPYRARKLRRKKHSDLVKKNFGNRKECFVCEKIKPLELHHLDGDRENNSIDNLYFVCAACHKLIHQRVNFLAGQFAS